MTINFINKENEKIIKIDWVIDSYKICGKSMTAELSSVVLFLRLN